MKMGSMHVLVLPFLFSDAQPSPLLLDVCLYGYLVRTTHFILANS